MAMRGLTEATPTSLHHSCRTSHRRTQVPFAIHSYHPTITHAHTLSDPSFLHPMACLRRLPPAITRGGNCGMKHKPCRLRGATGVRLNYDRSEMATDWRVLSPLTHADSPPLTAGWPGLQGHNAETSAVPDSSQSPGTATRKAVWHGRGEDDLNTKAALCRPNPALPCSSIFLNTFKRTDLHAS
ncbi:hypothetical protein E2C01_065817 [Portunus trituberculatus]|uniref:Uncharacterized protein n=1 Tax=Portunus trituberculatus TaxID=210409 RepID=A0A5B7HPC1_PORTR|nr:hypothetical protein [Portunus trituberculatus]